jgi:hypothetical protein
MPGDGSTLVSGKGPCAVTDGTLSCASGNTATVFGVSGSSDSTCDRAVLIKETE